MSETDTRRSAPAARGQADGAADTKSWFTVFADSFRSSAGVFAVVVIVVQALWRGGAVAGGFFTQDDYLMLARADEEPLGLSYLAAAHSGEFSPIGNLIVWATTQTAGMSWGAVVVIVVVLQAAVALMTWVVLTQVLEDRWVRIPLLTLACLTPLTLGNTMWWGLATMHLPAVLLLLVGVSALLAHLREGWEPGVGVAAAALSAVLFSSDRALLLPFIAFVVVAGMVRPDGMGVRQRLAATVARYAKVWLVLVAFLVGRVLLAVSQGNTVFGRPDSFAEAGSVLEEYGRQGVTGLAGGPWMGDVVGVVLVPAQTWPTTVAVLLCLALCIPVVRAFRDPVVAVTLGGLAVYLLLVAGLLVLSQDRLGAQAAASRFVADAAVVVVLCLAVALRRIMVPATLRRLIARGPGLAAVTLAVVVVASATITTRAALPFLKNEDDRTFVDNLRAGLEVEPRIVLLDTAVPEGVMSARFGAAAKVSTVAGLLPQRPTFDIPSEFLRIVDDAGTLREVQIGSGRVSATVPDDDCGLPITSVRSTIALDQNVLEGKNLIELVYFTNGDTYASVETGDAKVRVPVRSGVHKVQVPVAAQFDEIHLTLENVGQTMCISQLNAGAVQPVPLALAP